MPGRLTIFQMVVAKSVKPVPYVSAKPNASSIARDPTTGPRPLSPSSKAVAAYEFAKARVTGTEPNIGENRKVTVDMEQQD